jgi:beta-lactamase class A
MDRLEQALTALSDEQPFHTGWYFRDLRGGDVFERQGNVVVPSASTRKIAILMAALKAVNEGVLALDQPVTIEARYQNNDSGCFQHFQPGSTITLRDALVMMIIVSDNTCTGTVADLVSLEAVNRLCRDIGMTGTSHRFGIPPIGMAGYLPADQTNATTPADVGRLLELILRGSDDPDAAARLGCTPALCRLALDILSWQKLRNRLPSRLPRGTKVAHKTGTTAQNYNDAGIVYANDAPLFVLTAYTDRVPDVLPDGTPGHTGAQELIGRLCRHCYNALTDEA